MKYLLLLLLVVLSVMVWILNRVATRRNVNTHAMGICSSASGLVFNIIMAALSHKPIFSNIASPLGLVGGFAYSVGFLIVILKCLKIGPAAPTVMANNLGLLGAVVLGICFDFKTNPPSASIYLGVVCTLMAIVLVVKNGNSSSENLKVSNKWIILVVIGFLLSALSYAVQFLVTRYDSTNPYAFSIPVYGFSLVILICISVYEKKIAIGKQELAFGALVAGLNIIYTLLLFRVVAEVPSYIVFPISSATPIIIMLLIGQIFYKERLNFFGWCSCVLGTAGVALMNL